MKVRLTATVLGSLEGSQAWQKPGEDDLADDLFAIIRAAPSRKDGSCVVTLNDDGVAVLREYVETMRDASADDAGWDASARGDLNAARALLRKIERGGER